MLGAMACSPVPSGRTSRIPYWPSPWSPWNASHASPGRTAIGVAVGDGASVTVGATVDVATTAGVEVAARGALGAAAAPHPAPISAATSRRARRVTIHLREANRYKG